MPKYIRVFYLPWQSTAFAATASIGGVFAALACLVLSAMAISILNGRGGYPPIVMAQEAIILTMVLAGSCLSCTVSWSTNGVESERSKYLSRYPIPYMLFCLVAFIVRVSTTGFYLKKQYAKYYADSSPSVYVLESSAVLIMLLFWIVSFPFDFGFYTPLFKNTKAKTAFEVARSNYTAKQYIFVTFFISVESWTSNAEDEESGGGGVAAAATPTPAPAPAATTEPAITATPPATAATEATA